MHTMRTLIETIESPEFYLRADIFKLDNCHVYWIRFTDLLTSDIRVRVLFEHKEYSYKDIVDDVNAKLFMEVADSLTYTRTQDKVHAFG